MQAQAKRPNRLMAKLDEMFTTKQFTFSELLKMYIPLIIDQLFIYIIGMLSIALVSSSGETAMSAVSLVGPLGYLVTAIFTAIGMGGTIIVARARGAGEEEHMRSAIGQTILTSFLAAVVLGGIFIVFAAPLVNLMFASTAAAVKSTAISYLQVYSLSYFPYAIFNAIFNVFRGIGDSRSSLVLTIVINSVHLVCSVLFINVFQMGATGSALSYTVARLVGGVVAVLWMFVIHNQIGMKMSYLLRFTKKIQKEIAHLGVPFATEQIFFQAGLLVANMFIATLAYDSAHIYITAANGVAGSVYNMYFATAFSLQTMVTTVCGQCLGAKNYDLTRQYCRNFIKVGRFVLLATAIIVYACVPLMLMLYHPSAQAMPLIYQALLIAAIPLPILWCDAYLLPSMMRAAGDAAYTTVVTLVSMWVARVALGYFLTIICGFGILGYWACYGVEWLIRAVVFRLRMRGDKWLKIQNS